MKKAAPLRVLAICSNLCFLAYGIGRGLLPVMVLHGALLPINAWRLGGILCRLRFRSDVPGAITISDTEVELLSLKASVNPISGSQVQPKLGSDRGIFRARCQSSDAPPSIG
jgi:hypothetical protein